MCPVSPIYISRQPATVTVTVTRTAGNRGAPAPRPAPRPARRPAPRGPIRAPALAPAPARVQNFHFPNIPLPPIFHQCVPPRGIGKGGRVSGIEWAVVVTGI